MPCFRPLQEIRHEELVLRCSGYFLLDEEHEGAIMKKFADPRLEFSGNYQCAGYEELRSRFPGKSGRPPPIRAIVKKFGHATKVPQTMVF